jgi:hypothetical protein
MMVPSAHAGVRDESDAALCAFYTTALTALTDATVEFLVGGAFALQPYTGVVRDTKDLDIFIRPGDCERACEVLEAAGYQTEVTYPHWLAKAFDGERFLDIIFSSGNGIAEVDDEWFTYAVEAQLLGMPVLLCPPEETIWSKGFIMERERYDGADVAHLLRASAHRIDWQRLIRRFGDHWRVLFSHLSLFGYIYPAERALIPDWVHFHLVRRLLTEIESDPEQALVCRGTFLSRAQYLTDIEDWGYQDARTIDGGTMSPEDAALWSGATG